MDYARHTQSSVCSLALKCAEPVVLRWRRFISHQPTRCRPRVIYSGSRLPEILISRSCCSCMIAASTTSTLFDPISLFSCRCSILRATPKSLDRITALWYVGQSLAYFCDDVVLRFPGCRWDVRTTTNPATTSIGCSLRHAFNNQGQVIPQQAVAASEKSVTIPAVHST